CKPSISSRSAIRKRCSGPSTRSLEPESLADDSARLRPVRRGSDVRRGHVPARLALLVVVAPPARVGRLGAAHNAALCAAAQVPGLRARGCTLRRYAPARGLPEPT